MGSQSTSFHESCPSTIATTTTTTSTSWMWMWMWKIIQLMITHMYSEVTSRKQSLVIMERDSGTEIPYPNYETNMIQRLVTRKEAKRKTVVILTCILNLCIFLSKINKCKVL